VGHARPVSPLARGAGGVEVAHGSGGFQFFSRPGVVGGEPEQVRQDSLHLSGQGVPFPSQEGVLVGEFRRVSRRSRRYVWLSSQKSAVIPDVLYPAAPARQVRQVGIQHSARLSALGR